MPRAATPETATGEHLKDYVLMQSPTGDVRHVSANPGAIIPLMVAGWSQVFDTAPTAAPPGGPE